MASAPAQRTWTIPRDEQKALGITDSTPLACRRVELNGVQGLFLYPAEKESPGQLMVKKLRQRGNKHFGSDQLLKLMRKAK